MRNHFHIHVHMNIHIDTNVNINTIVNITPHIDNIYVININDFIHYGVRAPCELKARKQIHNVDAPHQGVATYLFCNSFMCS